MRQQHPEDVGPVDLLRVAGDDRAQPAPAGGGGPHVSHLSGRDDHDPPARGVDPPAEVQVVGKQRKRRVQTAQMVPGLAAHQRPGRPNRQHLADRVVLTLVVLRSVQPGLAMPAVVGRQTDLDQQPRVGPVAHLGTQQRRGGAAPTVLQQPFQGVGVWCAVIVQQPHPAAGRDSGQTGCHRRAVAGSRRKHHHLVRRQPGRPEQVGAAVGAAGVDQDDVPRDDGLRAQRRQRGR